MSDSRTPKSKSKGRSKYDVLIETQWAKAVNQGQQQSPFGRSSFSTSQPFSSGIGSNTSAGSGFGKHFSDWSSGMRQSYQPFDDVNQWSSQQSPQLTYNRFASGASSHWWQSSPLDLFSNHQRLRAKRMNTQSISGFSSDRNGLNAPIPSPHCRFASEASSHWLKPSPLDHFSNHQRLRAERMNTQSSSGVSSDRSDLNAPTHSQSSNFQRSSLFPSLNPLLSTSERFSGQYSQDRSSFGSASSDLGSMPQTIDDIYRDPNTGRPDFNKMRADIQNSQYENVGQPLSHQLAQKSREELLRVRRVRFGRSKRMENFLKSRGFLSNTEDNETRWTDPNASSYGPLERPLVTQKEECPPDFDDYRHSRPVSEMDYEWQGMGRRTFSLGHLLDLNQTRTQPLSLPELDLAEQYQEARDWDSSPILYQRKVAKPTIKSIRDSDTKALNQISIAMKKSKIRPERREYVRERTKLTPLLTNVNTSVPPIPELTSEEED